MWRNRYAITLRAFMKPEAQSGHTRFTFICSIAKTDRSAAIKIKTASKRNFPEKHQTIIALVGNITVVDTLIHLNVISNNYLNAMNASPISPPTICTPPSGIESPRKNPRMSKELADHGRFCSRIITLIL